MSATIYGSARFGVVDDSSATDLHVASLTYTSSVEEAFAKDNSGSDVAHALFNETVEISADGVVAAKTTGLTVAIADTVTLANESADTLSLNDQNLFATADANAAPVCTNVALTRVNNDFETGSLTLSFRPLIDTTATYTL